MPSKKIETYLGFCIRAGKLTLGVNAISTLKKGVYCILMDASTAKNSRKELMKLKDKLGCPLVETENLEGLVKRQGAKAAAVREPSLARAILAEFALGKNSGEGV